VTANKDGKTTTITIDNKDGQDPKTVEIKDGENGQDGRDGQDGANGRDGVDGKSPTIETADAENGTTIIVKDGDGNEISKKTITNGKDGVDGKDGSAGPRGPKGDKGDQGQPGQGGNGGSGNFNLTTNGDKSEIEKITDVANKAAATRIDNGETFKLNKGHDNIVIKQIENGYELATNHTFQVGEKGEPGRDGVDGFIGVNGKDGVSGVAINGKDGSIGLRGPKGADGKDGSSLTFKPAEGTGTIDERGKDGKDGSTAKDANATRIVYETKGKDGRDITREVATTDDGLYFQGDNTDVTLDRKLNTRLDVKGGADSTKLTEKNIGVVGRIDKDGNRVLDVKLAENIDLGDKGSVKTGDTTINDNGVTINNGPSITKDGIDAGNTVITNVAPGVNPTDAVNVSQLKQNIGDVNNRINKLDKDYQAGIAGVAALAGLPEIHMAGHSMLSAAVGNHKGQSALAVGYSRLSDNSKVKLKIQGSANTQGDITTSVGIGYAW
ncbi:YadA-like family protein, partial [Neisseria sp. ZJ104]